MRLLETLHDGLLHRTQQVFVHLGGEGVVQEDVGPLLVRSERPDGTSRQKIPVVVGLEKLTWLISIQN